MDSVSGNYDDLDIEASNNDDFRGTELRSKLTPKAKHFLKNYVVKLDDGTHGYVFSYEEDGKGNFIYICHVCQVDLNAERVVEQHITGKKHCTNMQKQIHTRDKFTRIVEDSTVELQPGEPAPPGMEDLVEAKCIIQPKLDANKSKPMIGLEYLIEVIDSDSIPSYCCLLCNKQGPDNNIIGHLSSQQHYMKYLQNFFPLVFSALSLVPKSPEFKKGFIIVLERIIKLIESTYGRLKPRQCNLQGQTFQEKKSGLLNSIEQEFHFREYMSDNYVNMVDWTEIKKLQFYNEDDEVVVKEDKPIKTEHEHNEDKSLFNRSAKPNFKRQLRKDRESFDDVDEKPVVKKSSSPDLEIIGVTKLDNTVKKRMKREKSLSSVSTISSDSMKSAHHRRSRTRSRSSTRSRRGRSPYTSRYRYRSRSIERRKNSPYRRYPPRSKSRSPRRRFRDHRRSRSRSNPRFRYRRPAQPVLPYPRRRRSHSRSRSRSRSPRFSHDSKYSSSRNKPYTRKEAVDPSSSKYKYESTKHSTNKPNGKYKWEKFCDEMKPILKEFEDKLKYYEKNPEKHPQYPEEWKLFWNRRYKEIQSEGKDPAKHDFKPEWITYWNIRMKELSDDELKAKRDEVKKQLGIIEEDLNKFANAPDKVSDIPDRSEELKKDITVDDIKNTWKALTGSEIKEPIKNPSLLVDEVPLDEELDIPYLHSGMSKRAPPGARKGFIPFNDNAPRVIAVLRLIAVLESQLGSLGPKVLQLLSNAIAMEKVSPGSSQQILGEDQHVVLFETVKEKFKGMLFAGLVERHLVNTTKHVLRDIDDLFLCAPKVLKKESTLPSFGPVPTPVPAPVTATPVSVPGVGTVDRVAIAQQIAGALIAQGKTDVTEAELEQLINAVVGMAQASSNNVGPITTAEYINLQSQNAEKSGNNVLSTGLKLLQSAYEDESKMAEDSSDKKRPLEKALASFNSPMKHLSDSELKVLVENFRELDVHVQYKLIDYFKKLESTDPQRVASLQKTVNFKVLVSSETSEMKPPNMTRHGSPFPLQLEGGNSASDSQELNSKHYNIHNEEEDEDDDDYSVEDVYKAASENLRQQELSQERRKNDSILPCTADVAKITGSIGNSDNNPVIDTHKSNLSINEFRPALFNDVQQFTRGSSGDNYYQGHSFQNSSLSGAGMSAPVTRGHYDKNSIAESYSPYEQAPRHSNTFGTVHTPLQSTQYPLNTNDDKHRYPFHSKEYDDQFRNRNYNRY